MNFEKVIQLIDQAHAEDPSIELVNGESISKELLYSTRMSDCLLEFFPSASELQQIGAKCQHLKRWEVPRDTYPMGKKGYYQWRTYLYDYQAEKAAEIMNECGYSKEAVEEVKAMVAKKQVKTNSSSQLLEDVACLIFIQFYLKDFAVDYEEEKLIKIIQRTWNKMSEQAQQFALKLSLKDDVGQIIGKALA